MFTGLIEGMGNVARLARRGGAMRLEIDAPDIAEELKAGDSICVNGACVTVTDVEGSIFAADLVPETLGRSNLGTLILAEEVNLERPLKANGRLDGHIVQGHVDVVGLVRSRRRVGAQELLEINVPFELTRYLAAKGSVSVDGVSLTVVDVNKDRFRVALIPHTMTTTTLGKKIQGQAVNVEVDVISKYVERHITARMPQKAPSIAALVAQHDAEHRAGIAASSALNATATFRAPEPSLPTTPSTPRSQPVTRPAPPPRQQPPRFTLSSSEQAAARASEKNAKKASARPVAHKAAATKTAPKPHAAKKAAPRPASKSKSAPRVVAAKKKPSPSKRKR